MAQDMPADVAPGMAEGVPPGTQPTANQSAGDQVAQLVGGISESMNLLQTILESTPGAPQEALGLMANATESFAQAMQLMTGGATEDEAASEPETSIEGQAALQNKPAFKPKGMNSI